MADSKKNKKSSKGRSNNDRQRSRASGKELTADELENVAGGSLDARIHFKYDLKAQKET
jgi:hypothetical protein